MPVSARIKRRVVALGASLLSAAALVAAPAAQAATSMREWVPATQLGTQRALIAQFSNPTQLSSDWFEVADLAGITCIADPAGSGAMGIHYANGARIFDGILDATQPEAAVYEPRADGSLHLVAFEYIVIADQWGPTAPELFPGHPFMFTGANNRFGLPAFWSQHVWVGKGNPNGNLAMWNPNIHC